jgi:CP family cyanate transporter-like MFS transporter
MATRSDTPTTARAARALSLPLVLTALVIAGFNLRTVLLEVPPILPLIQHDLGLNYTATGLLNSLPLLILGGLAYPAALAIGRIGARWAMAVALLLITAFALLRTLAPNVGWLFMLTVLLSGAIALGQTAVPMFIHEYFPRFIGQVTAAYSTGLMIGEVAAASLTVPLVLPLFAGGQWRATFIFWSVPVLAAFVLWLCAVPRPLAVAESVEKALLTRPARVNLRAWRIWQSSLLLGGGSLLFFGMDTWIPVYYHHLGRSDGSLALAVLTIAQLPASLALTAWGQHLAGRPIGFVLAGGTASVASIAWFIAPVGWDVVLTGIIGAASAALFVLCLSLPPYLASGAGVAQVSGIMLGISYTLAFAGPFLGGVLWDKTHIPVTAFIPIMLACIATTILGAFLPDLRQQPGG